MNPLGKKLEILHDACDLALGGIELFFAHQRRRSRQTPARAVGDLHDHRQIPQQLIRQGRGVGLGLLMGFKKKFGVIENALPYWRRGIAPSGVEFTGLPACETMRGKRIRHALAVLDVGARHRYQILHRDVSRDLADANLLLDLLRKKFHQR